MSNLLLGLYGGIITDIAFRAAAFRIPVVYRRQGPRQGPAPVLDVVDACTIPSDLVYGFHILDIIEPIFQLFSNELAIKQREK